MLILLFSQANAQQRLVIVGGGERPKAAMSKFVEWAGGAARARILFIPWATSEPEASFKYFKESLAAFSPQEIEVAPVAPLTEEKKSKFLSQLKNATGVFFGGGDQTRIMTALKDESLLQALKQRYAAGTVFGGTSAGAAIMSAQMITGEGDFTVIDGSKVQTNLGLGLLPDYVIVDQHFIKRQRENRLFGLILQNPEKFGVGIDESTAILVTDNRFAEVVGASQVMLISANAGQRQALIIYLAQPGDRFDLRKRKLDKRKVASQSK
ncbi:MAG TPA: cyanophycinase [Pyrinomonadaceae bacterium]